MPYIWPARSSKRRINSISVYQRFRASAETWGSAGLTLLVLRVTAILAFLRTASKHGVKSGGLQPQGTASLGCKEPRRGFRAAPASFGFRVLNRVRSARAYRANDHDFIGRREIERPPHLRVEQVGVEVAGAH